ncbi:MAG: hypothetical protein H8M99_12635 [Gloeobacteraceae cyanobacterium ES-bin-144]|nr:hypothetical protein [Verrucomicrobiales bacterium]
MFRVPRDHDGSGIVCPSCRRMLRIPSATDVVSPLIATVQESATPDGESFSQQKERRRKKKNASARGADHTWEHSQKASKKSKSKEKRQMLWMLLGGGALFITILVGILIALMNGGKRTQQQPLAAPPVSIPIPPEVPAPATTTLSESEFLSKAEPLARKFLEATHIEDMLSVIHTPDTTEPKIRKWYPDGKITAPGIATFNSQSDVLHQGAYSAVFIQTRDFEEKPIAFFRSADGELKIDWESFVGWSIVPWDEFIATQPTTPNVFRVILRPVEYYNFAFSDEQKWQSYQLESPDGKHSLYGYAERGSILESRLRLGPDIVSKPLMLSLKFPQISNSPKQVIIANFISEGWISESE